MFYLCCKWWDDIENAELQGLWNDIIMA